MISDISEIGGPGEYGVTCVALLRSAEPPLPPDGDLPPGMPRQQQRPVVERIVVFPPDDPNEEGVWAGQLKAEEVEHAKVDSGNS